MLKKVYTMIAIWGVSAALTACHSNMRREEEIAGTITQETAVVENQVSTEVLIAYLSDAKIPEESASQIETAVQIIKEVTGGSIYDIGTQTDLPAVFGTIFLGFSSSSAELPSSLTDFLEHNDFGEKTIIPFIMKNEENSDGAISALYDLEPESEFLDEYEMKGGDSGELIAGIEEWLSELGYNR